MISTPLLWIVFPLIASVVLYLIHRMGNWLILLGGVIAFILALLAWVIPVGSPVEVGFWTFRIDPVLNVFGRSFILEDGDRGLIGLVYLIASVWFFGSFLAHPNRLFIPLAFAMISVLIAALAIEPFLFAALFIELAVLISLPILVPPGNTPGQGVLRYLSLQTLGVPFILLTGWLLSGVEGSPTDRELIVQAAVLMGFGFSFWLAVFPFHTWIPMLAEEAEPYVVGFVLLIIPGIISVFGLSFLDRYVWLRNSNSVFGMLRAVGFLMVLTGGIWVMFQQHMGRIFGYVSIIEIGLSILSIGLGSSQGIIFFFSLFLTKFIGYFMWVLALSVILKRNGSLEFSKVRGFGYQYPVISITLVLAHLSIAGFPLLIGFPIHLALWEQLAGNYPLFAFGAVFGGFGAFIGGLRTIAVLVTSPGDERLKLEESSMMRVTFGIGSALLVLGGLFPHWIFRIFEGVPLVFERIF